MTSAARASPSERTDYAVCALLLVLITLLRLAVSNPIEAVGFLYVIPISLLASVRGLRGGLIAAAGAMLCTIAWAVLQDVPLGLVSYAARAVTFFGVGVFVGLQTQERLGLEREREDLLAELQATVQSIAPAAAISPRRSPRTDASRLIGIT